MDGDESAVPLQMRSQPEEPGTRLSRLIWLPTGSSSGQPEQQNFIDALRSKTELQRGGYLIEDIWKDEDALRITLKKLEELAPKKTEASGAGREHNLSPLRAGRSASDNSAAEVFKGGRLEVQLPVFEGDAAHRAPGSSRTADQLRRGAGLLRGRGRGVEANDGNYFAENQNLRGGKPLLNIFTYLAPPMTGHKQDCIDMGEENLIMGLETFSEAAMQPLIEAMKGA